MLLWGYGYDATGNRTSTAINGTPTSYTYPANSHRLSSVGGVGRSYDNAGNTTAIGGAAREFVYGGNNRTREVKQGGVVTMNYRYNGRGEQVRRFVGSTNTYTVFDEAGRWLGDYATPTTPIRQAIWLDDLPVGVLVGAGSSQKLHYIEPDALGTPRVVIDPARDVPVWTWDLRGEAFGNDAPNQDPDGDGTQFVFDMRFPGQRYDAASSLNYNYFRDYDAISGRYVQSDPIGLNGDISTYSYTGANPGIAIDLFGLCYGHPLNYAFSPNCPPPSSRRPQYHRPPPGPNGCGAEGSITQFVIPQFPFRQCCDQHDLCYGRCKARKSDCDSNFLNCMSQRCTDFRGVISLYSACLLQAATYYDFVRGGGSGPYANAQQKCKPACKTDH